MAVEEGTPASSSKPPSYRTAAAKEAEEGESLLNKGGGEGGADRGKNGTYRGTLVVADLGWLDFNLDIPLSAKFRWGSREFGGTDRAARQYDGTQKSESTHPRSTTTSVTL